MPGRGLVVAVAVAVIVAVATTAGCASSTRSDQLPGRSRGNVQGGSDSSSAAASELQGLSAAGRVLALAAAHRDANQIAVGRNSQQVSGWPSGISAVTAVVQPGTVTNSNTGHTCDSGTIIAVRLVGAFDTVTTGTSTGAGTSSPDTTVREIDLSVDATTGLTCLISVRTEPVPQSRGDSVLYSR